MDEKNVGGPVLNAEAEILGIVLPPIGISPETDWWTIALSSIDLAPIIHDGYGI